ncbi:MAG: DoxX family protein [Spirochaetia bacterium]|nr:DoxX family protein [Spirochaetia bacterium]
MFERLLESEANLALTFLRITLGMVMLPHGLQKLLGWFDGFGYRATMDFFGTMGIPSVIAFLIIVAESFGAFAMILGFCTRPAALGLFIVMVGAAFLQSKNGFFMNWYGNQAGEGIEYHILILGICVGLIWAGAGAVSVDRWILDRLK